MPNFWSAKIFSYSARVQLTKHTHCILHTHTHTHTHTPYVSQKHPKASFHAHQMAQHSYQSNPQLPKQVSEQVNKLIRDHVNHAYDWLSSPLPLSLCLYLSLSLMVQWALYVHTPTFSGDYTVIHHCYPQTAWCHRSGSVVLYHQPLFNKLLQEKREEWGWKYVQAWSHFQTRNSK